MNEPLDDLIRNAKPQVPPEVWERVRAFATSANAVRGSGFVLLRIAALLMIACTIGAITAWIASSGQKSSAEIQQLSSHADKLLDRASDLDKPAGEKELAALESRVGRIETGRDLWKQAIRGAVAAEFERQRAEEKENWRRKHVSYIQRKFAAEADSLISTFQQELALTNIQNKAVQELLDRQGKKIEQLISAAYYDELDDYDLHDRLVLLSEDTNEKLAALLDPVQRKGYDGNNIISTNPVHWAPSNNFRSASDADALAYWITITKED